MARRLLRKGNRKIRSGTGFWKTLSWSSWIYVMPLFLSFLPLQIAFCSSLFDSFAYILLCQHIVAVNISRAPFSLWGLPWLHRCYKLKRIFLCKIHPQLVVLEIFFNKMSSIYARNTPLPVLQSIICMCIMCASRPIESAHFHWHFSTLQKVEFEKKKNSMS